MNPLSNLRNITQMNEKELELGVSEKASWHQIYKDSSWIFFGGVDSDLTEGDMICVFSQWGEVVNIHLVRDRITGRSKGFGFLAYYNQKSTILAVDNANGIKLCGRLMRVDHCENYQIPKNLNKLDSETRELIEKGCAPQPICIKKGKDQKEDNQKDDKKKEKRRHSHESNKRKSEEFDSVKLKKKEDNDGKKRKESFEEDSDHKRSNIRDGRKFTKEVEREPSKKDDFKEVDYRQKKSSEDWMHKKSRTTDDRKLTKDFKHSDEPRIDDFRKRDSHKAQVNDDRWKEHSRDDYRRQDYRRKDEDEQRSRYDYNNKSRDNYRKEEIRQRDEYKKRK